MLQKGSFRLKDILVPKKVFISVVLFVVLYGIAWAIMRHSIGHFGSMDGSDWLDSRKTLFFLKEKYIIFNRGLKEKIVTRGDR